MPISSGSPPQPRAFLRLVVFVDAGYLRRAAERTEPGRGKAQIDPQKLTFWIETRWRPWRFVRAYIYDAEHDRERRREQWLEQRRWFDEVGDTDRLDLRLGHLVGDRPPFRQKGVDTLLVLDMLRLAQANVYDVAGVIAGDADFVEVVDAVKRLGKEVVVAGGQGIADRLRHAADLYVDLEDKSLQGSAVIRWQLEESEGSALGVAGDPGVDVGGDGQAGVAEDR